MKLWKMVCGCIATETEIKGDGSSESMSGDFPAATGLAPVNQGHGSSGSGAPPARSYLQRGRDPVEEEEGLFCIFFLFLGSFCKNDVLIHCLLPAKKKTSTLDKSISNNKIYICKHARIFCW